MLVGFTRRTSSVPLVPPPRSGQCAQDRENTGSTVPASRQQRCRTKSPRDAIVVRQLAAQVDRPAGGRVPLAVLKPISIYADDPSAPPAARAVRPEFLAQMIDRTEMARFWVGPEGTQVDPAFEGDGELARERRRRSVLIVRLAAELYRREHGAAPATAARWWGVSSKIYPRGSRQRNRFRLGWIERADTVIGAA